MKSNYQTYFCYILSALQNRCYFNTSVRVATDYARIREASALAPTLTNAILNDMPPI